MVKIASENEASHDKVMRALHTLLLETEVREGKMVCGNCGHEYRIKEGIANFLLPSHLGELSPLHTYDLALHVQLNLQYRVPFFERSTHPIYAMGLCSSVVV